MSGADERSQAMKVAERMIEEGKDATPLLLCELAREVAALAEIVTQQERRIAALEANR